MLIARALPLIHVYLKPGGQKGFSGHWINLPQNVSELAQTLSRYPKELSVIIIEVKGKDNNYKDLFVRRQNVAKALQWLITNNPHYKDIIVNQNSLRSLPDNGIPNELLSVETEDFDDSQPTDPDIGALNQNEDDIDYTEGTKKNSFLPIPDCQLKEAQAIQQHLCQQPDHIRRPTVGHEPINEYINPFLATLAFPTMFPDACGDPTNPALL